MAVWKVVFVSCLFALSANTQEAPKKTETRGNFGGGGGGFGGRPGGFGGGGNFGGGGFPGGGGIGGGGFPGGGGIGGGGFPGGGGFGGGGFHGGGGFPGGGGGVGFPGSGINQPFPAGGHGGHGGGGGFIQPGGFPGGVVGGPSGGIGSSGCRYWCKTPEGQAYCCESNAQAPKHPVAALIQKDGECPPVRAECPLRIFGGPPQTCSKHGDCYGTERCCFDRCLNEHVCKEPFYG